MLSVYVFVANFIYFKILVFWPVIFFGCGPGPWMSSLKTKYNKFTSFGGQVKRLAVAGEVALKSKLHA